MIEEENLLDLMKKKEDQEKITMNVEGNLQGKIDTLVKEIQHHKIEEDAILVQVLVIIDAMIKEEEVLSSITLKLNLVLNEDKEIGMLQINALKEDREIHHFKDIRNIKGMIKKVAGSAINKDQPTTIATEEIPLIRSKTCTVKNLKLKKRLLLKVPQRLLMIFRQAK